MRGEMDEGGDVGGGEQGEEKKMEKGEKIGKGGGGEDRSLTGAKEGGGSRNIGETKLKSIFPD